MESSHIIISGPMVAGKSTAARFLTKSFKNTIHHPEINQYTLFGNSHPGGVFVDKKLETRIIKADLDRLKKINLDKRELIHLIETDIFHCVYVAIIDRRKKALEMEEKYKRLHDKVKTGVLFINTTPTISWARRRSYYLKRALVEIKKRNLKGVEAKKFRDKTMRKYKKRIFELYPLWFEMFEKLPYPKVKIPNNGRDLKVFEKKVIDGFLKLTKKMKIHVKS